MTIARAGHRGRSRWSRAKNAVAAVATVWARCSRGGHAHECYQLLRDVERRVALAVLLAQPDPPELHRGSRTLLEGRPDRHQVVPDLTAAYVQAKLLEWRERDEASAEMTRSAEPVTVGRRNARTHIAVWEWLRSLVAA